MDWNNDGKKDLITGEREGQIRIYLNTATDAAPAFDGYTRLQLNGADFDCGYSSKPDVVDWNNDGKKDVVCGEDNGCVYLLLNTGTDAAPVFTSAVLLQNGGSNLNVVSRASPCVADGDCDGKKDLLVGDTDGYISFFRNVGTDASPQFNGVVLLQAGGSNLDSGWYSRPTVADWNYDGMPDILCGTYEGAALYYQTIPNLLVHLPASVTEGDGVLAGAAAVSVRVAPSSDLVVMLASEDPTEVTTPPAVVIPAWATNAVFDLTVVDDDILDGAREAPIIAAAAKYGAHRQWLSTLDNETATLSVSLPASATEGDGILVGQGTVSVDAVPDEDIAISFASDDPSEAAASDTVILAGHLSAPFDVVIADDFAIDGDQTVSIIAQVANWTQGADMMTVFDNEDTNLTVFLPAEFGESSGLQADAGRVEISGFLASPLTVSLNSDDPSELTAPVTTTIPTGLTSATFDLIVQDDALSDGLQTATVTATAPGFGPGDDTLAVRDDEIESFAFSAIASPQTAGVGFSVTITALDAYGVRGWHTGSSVLTATGDAGALPTVPTSAGPFIAGVWSGGAQIDAVDANAQLTVTDEAESTGASAVFSVEPGPLDHFFWNPVVSPQYCDNPFPVTLTARDANNYVATSFAGPVALFLIFGVDEIGIGAGANAWGFPMYTYYEDARTQVIYPAEDVGQSGAIIALALDVTGLPGLTMNNWSIRLRHTSLASYPVSPAWESAGWTTCYQANELVSETGWVTFTFNAPFAYNGVDNLMIDFSFNNSDWTFAGNCRYTAAAATRAIYAYTDSGFGDPLAWAGVGDAGSPTPQTGASVPNVKLLIGETVDMTPASSGGFVDGVWSGSVRALETCSNAYLRAADGGKVVTDSALFDVLSQTADMDGDTLPDLWEIQHGGTNEFSGAADWDGDGLTDRGEYVAGTAPTNAHSTFEITALSTAVGRIVHFYGRAGRVYRARFCADLHVLDWQDLAGVDIVPATNGWFSINDTNPPPYRCYRLTVELNP